MESKYIKKARSVVTNYINTVKNTYCININKEFDYDETFVVWFSKTLQNWKALVGIANSNMYFEITYNGDEKETYLDVYKKCENIVLHDISISSVPLDDLTEEEIESVKQMAKDLKNKTNTISLTHCQKESE